MKLFSGSSNKPLVQKIAQKLQVRLSPIEIFVFPDGERRVQIQEPVIEEDCVVVQSTNPPVDQNYMELFFIVDALKRSGARSVTAVVPYMGYQRQDHVFRDGEAVSLDVVIKTLEANGVDKFIAFDFHSIKIPELFYVPVVHLSALPLFAEKIKRMIENVEGAVLVSPDMGGIRRIKMLSEMLNNMAYACVVKNRDLATGQVSSDEIRGEVSGKTAYIVDDMISSGKTIDAASNLLSNHGAQKIYVFATHAIFSKDAAEVLQNSLAEDIFVTDTVYIPKEKHFAKLEIISVADMIVDTLNENT